MTDYACIVQRGQAPAARRGELEQGLRRIGRERLGDAAEAEIQWVEIEAGYGFSAGQPSTSSIVVRSVAPGFPEAEREAFMHQVCELWTGVTGCHIDEVVVTAMDGPLPL